MGQMYIRRCKGLVKAKQQRVNCAEVCAIKKCKQVRLVQSLPSQKQLTNKHSSELSCECVVAGWNVSIRLDLTVSQYLVFCVKTIRMPKIHVQVRFEE